MSHWPERGSVCVFARVRPASNEAAGHCGSAARRICSTAYIGGNPHGADGPRELVLLGRTRPCRQISMGRHSIDVSPPLLYRVYLRYELSLHFSERSL